LPKKSSLAQYRPLAKISQASIVERPTSTPARRKSAGRQSRNSQRQQYTSSRLDLPRNSSERQVERRSSMCLRQDGPSGETSTRPDQLSRRSSFHVGHGDFDSVGTWSLAHR